MAMARIYWDLQNYPMVEKIFRQSAEFCSEHDVWKLNVAHVFFMQGNQDNKYNEAIRYYDPFYKRCHEDLLEVRGAFSPTGSTVVKPSFLQEQPSGLAQSALSLVLTLE